jgi:hypothetical protein
MTSTLTVEPEHGSVAARETGADSITLVCDLISTPFVPVSVLCADALHSHLFRAELSSDRAFWTLTYAAADYE